MRKDKPDKRVKILFNRKFMFRYNFQRVLITRFMFEPLIKNCRKLSKTSSEKNSFMLILQFFYGLWNCRKCYCTKENLGGLLTITRVMKSRDIDDSDNLFVWQKFLRVLKGVLKFIVVLGIEYDRFLFKLNVIKSTLKENKTVIIYRSLGAWRRTVINCIILL